MSFFQNTRIRGNRNYGRINMYRNNGEKLRMLNPWEHGFYVRVVDEKSRIVYNLECIIQSDCNVRLTTLFQNYLSYKLQGVYVTFNDLLIENRLRCQDITIANLSDFELIQTVAVEATNIFTGEYCIPGIIGYIECPFQEACKHNDKNCCFIHSKQQYKLYEQETYELELSKNQLQCSLRNSSWRHNGTKAPLIWEIFSRGMTDTVLNKAHLFLPLDIQQIILDQLTEDGCFMPNFDAITDSLNYTKIMGRYLYHGDVKNNSVNIYLSNDSNVYLSLYDQLFLRLKMMSNKKLAYILNIIQVASSYITQKKKLPRNIKSKLKKNCFEVFQKQPDGLICWTFNRQIRIVSNPRDSSKNILRLSNGLSIYNPKHCGRVMGSFCDFTHIHVLDESKNQILGVSNKYFDGNHLLNVCNIIMFDENGLITKVCKLICPEIANNNIYCYDFTPSHKYGLIYFAINQGFIYTLKIDDFLMTDSAVFILQVCANITISYMVINIIQTDVYLFICDQFNLLYMCLSDDGTKCKICNQYDRYLYERIPFGTDDIFCNISLCIYQQNKYNIKIALLRLNGIYLYDLYSISQVSSTELSYMYENNLLMNKLRLYHCHMKTLFTLNNLMYSQTLLYDGKQNFIVHSYDSIIMISMNGISKILAKVAELPIIDKLFAIPCNVHTYRGMFLNNKYMVLINNYQLNISQLLY